jgi:hypothetical protein
MMSSVVVHRARRWLSAFCLFASSTLAVSPAFAEQFLQWDDFGSSFATFRPFQPVMIGLGQIEFACDTFFPTADIYVVPAGSAQRGADTARCIGAAEYGLWGTRGCHRLRAHRHCGSDPGRRVCGGL